MWSDAEWQQGDSHKAAKQLHGSSNPASQENPQQSELGAEKKNPSDVQ